jgi:hypothetical protein
MMCEFNNTPLANVVMVHIIILNNKNVYKFLNIIITQIVKILNRHVKILRQSIPKIIIIILF